MQTASVTERQKPLIQRQVIPTQMSKPVLRTKADRPGWIPLHINSNWDTDPYAYQTEEEMMPQGGPHGQLSTYICELLRSYLKERNLMLLQDPFLLYQDQHNIKQRIAPDLLLMPYDFPAPSAYDMDVQPAPTCVVEITSPTSHEKDLNDNKALYMSLGISTYLVIDAITPSKQLRPQIKLYVWRNVYGKVVEMVADNEGCFMLPEMGLKIGADGQKLFFIDSVTGQILLNVTELKQALESEVQRAIEESKRADAEAKRANAEAERADAEAKRAEMAWKRAEREAERAKSEACRAESEAKRAQAAEQRVLAETKRANAEAKARIAAEAEIARLKTLLG